jgi:acetyl-CoA carboxylase biotin carboxyl carrier protein
MMEVRAVDTTNIEKLIEIMDRAKLTALRFDDGEIKIEVERDATSSGSLPLIAERAAQFLGSGERALKHTDANIAVTDKDEESTVLVRSPMVGTFYSSPSPDEKPFVTVGQEVQVGQTLGIVEVMKMMNEIVAETSGIVLEVLVANGSQIEYDQPLFRLTSK